MGAHSIHLFNSNHISTPSNARHLSEALALSLSSPSLYLGNGICLSVVILYPFLSVTHQGIIMDFGPQEVSFLFFFLPKLGSQITG